MKYFKIGIVVLLVLCIPFLGSFMSFSFLANDIHVTDAIAVAVVNEDAGDVYAGEDINLGQSFVQQFEKNTEYDFTVVSIGAAEKGLNEGLYDVYINIPYDFTEKSLAIDSENPDYVKLYYKASPVQSYLSKTNGEKCVADLRALINEKVVELYIVSMIKNIQAAQSNVNYIIGNEEDHFDALLEEDYPALEGLLDKWGLVDVSLTPLKSSINSGWSAAGNLMSMLEINMGTIGNFQQQLEEMVVKQQKNTQKSQTNVTLLENLNQSVQSIDLLVQTAHSENTALQGKTETGKNTLLDKLEKYSSQLELSKDAAEGVLDKLERSYGKLEKYSQSLEPAYINVDAIFGGLEEYIQELIDDIGDGPDVESEYWESVSADLKVLLEDVFEKLNEHYTKQLIASYVSYMENVSLAGGTTDIEQWIHDYIKWVTDGSGSAAPTPPDDGTIVFSSVLDLSVLSAETDLDESTITLTASVSGTFELESIAALDDDDYEWNPTAETITVHAGADLSEIDSLHFRFVPDTGFFPAASGDSLPKVLVTAEVYINYTAGGEKKLNIQESIFNGTFALDAITQEYFGCDTLTLYQNLKAHPVTGPLSALAQENSLIWEFSEPLENIVGDLEGNIAAYIGNDHARIGLLLNGIADKITEAKDDLEALNEEFQEAYENYEESLQSILEGYEDCFTSFQIYLDSLEVLYGSGLSEIVEYITEYNIEIQDDFVTLNSGLFPEILEGLSVTLSDGDSLLTETSTTLSEKHELDEVQYTISTRGESILSTSEHLYETSESHTGRLQNIDDEISEVMGKANTASNEGNSAIQSLDETIDQWSDVIDTHNEYQEEFEKVFANSQIGTVDNNNLFKFMSSPIQSENLASNYDLSRSIFPFILITLILISGIFTSYVFYYRWSMRRNEEQGGTLNRTLAIMFVAALVEGGIIAVVSSLLTSLQLSTGIYLAIVTIAFIELVTAVSYLMLKYLKIVGLGIDFILILVYIIVNGLLTFHDTSSGSFLSVIWSLSPFTLVENLLRSILYNSGISILGMILLVFVAALLVGATFALTNYSFNKRRKSYEV